MEQMKDNLPEVDMEKLRIVLDVKERYLSGALPLDEARAILRERVKTLRPYEIALAEQEIKTIEDDECRKEVVPTCPRITPSCATSVRMMPCEGFSSRSRSWRSIL